ncbi:alkane 1-monooxygenase [Hahella sp. CCB-MM4]|uniref:alkane 1-monooxygenase n=1 Tax=Hahella sp. (strain CCB-MM4) TaxID=1926491 RepID=UPI000B9C31A9|nr:alkane 1-monooxygenase [Hahella sp. CCB-MM4]OZG71241.1 alkane 1-monooxygenase [Hahella sp. CCB-MM4]
MLTHLPQQLTLNVKKWSFLLFLLPATLPYGSYLAGKLLGDQTVTPYLTFLFVFGLVPILDLIIGKDPTNPDEQLDTPIMSQDPFYKWLTLGSVPLYLVLIMWGAYVFSTNEFSLAGKIGWILSIGTVGALGITVAHELIHKDAFVEKNAGGILLSMVFYGGFKVEHLRGHHVNVSTPLDASSARYNQSLYQFLPHAYLHNFLNAWKLESRRLKKKGCSPFSLQNELIWWYGLSLIWLAVCIFFWGIEGGLFFLGQSFIAFTLLEIVNYLEHYGLHRRQLDNGKFERVTPEHSWNSNYFLTNLFLFHLQRHSDHHANAKRRYQVLRHYESAPQLPAGYAAMVVLALIPPLWFKVMNPRVEAYYENEFHHLT